MHGLHSAALLHSSRQTTPPNTGLYFLLLQEISSSSFIQSWPWFRTTFRASDSPSDWRAEVTVWWWCGPALPVAFNHGVCFTTVCLVSWTKVNWWHRLLSCYRIFTRSLKSWLLAVMPTAQLVYKFAFTCDGDNIEQRSQAANQNTAVTCRCHMPATMKTMLPAVLCNS